jgi:hypothetical protein
VGDSGSLHWIAVIRVGVGARSVEGLGKSTGERVCSVLGLEELGVFDHE